MRKAEPGDVWDPANQTLLAARLTRSLGVPVTVEVHGTSIHVTVPGPERYVWVYPSGEPWRLTRDSHAELRSGPRFVTVDAATVHTRITNWWKTRV